MRIAVKLKLYLNFGTYLKCKDAPLAAIRSMPHAEPLRGQLLRWAHGQHQTTSSTRASA